MESVKGYVSGVRYHSEKTGYAVLSFVTDGREETVVVSMPSVSEGELFEFSGDWSEHPVYGHQFKAVSYRAVRPDDEVSIIRYLGSGIIKGVGPKLAKKIVDEFGDDTFKVLEEQPEMLARIKGITLKKAQEIGTVISEKRSARDVMLYLGNYGISNSLAIKIYAAYGDEVYRVLNENPYRLADDIQGVGFKTADAIAASLGFTPDSEYRIQGGILYTLQNAMGQGFMYLPREELVRVASDVLSVDHESVENGISSLCMEQKLLIKKEAVYTPMCYYTEQACAGMLRTISQESLPEKLADDFGMAKEIESIAKSLGMQVDENQLKAVKNAVKNGLSIITGGPGTGKTTTIRTIIAYFERKGMDILLAAPTGRAAKRMTEATGYEARTIHRMLEFRPGNSDDGMGVGFERNDENPLEADVIIIDEMSMVDIFIFRALLKAVPPGAHLVLVGDANQLPSVGPGQVLRDLLECERFPVTALRYIYRQKGNGDIVSNAHRINNGEYISTESDGNDFFFLERNDTGRILSDMLELVKNKLPAGLGVDTFDIQILTPMRKGNIGVESLNRFLQEKLNPPDKSKKECTYGENTFREGDKVMQIRNNYQAVWQVFGKYGIPTDAGEGVFNGDIGRVREIAPSVSTLTVEFDDGKCVDYPFSDLDQLELAYAITVHKSQGSEYDAVIIPIAEGPKQLMNRNLLYTAVTRAKKCLIILGSMNTVKNMIDNERENLRYSGLKDRISEIFEC